MLTQGVDLLPRTLTQLAPMETQLLVVIVMVLLVRHAHGLLCSILGLPENWIMLLFKLLAKWFWLG
jgi:hypothetical protein